MKLIKLSNIYDHNEQLKETVIAICKGKEDLAEDVVQDMYLDLFTKYPVNKEFAFSELKTLCRKIAFDKYKIEDHNPAKASQIIHTRNDDDFDIVEAIADEKDQVEITKEDIVGISTLRKDKKTFRGNWLDFETAREFARTLGFQFGKDWTAWASTSARPENIPRQPASCVPYKSFWKGWDDWLGVKPLNFEEARAIVKSTLVPRGVNNSSKYYKAELPIGLPRHPDKVYITEFVNWPHWFGNEEIKHKQNRELFTYEQAKVYVQENLVPLGIDTLHKYTKYKNLPISLPKRPYQTYAGKGWIDSQDFFGVESKKIFQKKVFWSYDESARWVHFNLLPLGIITSKIYSKWTYSNLEGDYPTRPEEMPGEPWKYYKSIGEWKGWGRFLGTMVENRKTKEDFWEYDQAREWIAKHFGHIGMTEKAWEQYKRKELPLHDIPEDLHFKIPRMPEKVYLNRGWKGWEHWFSKEKWNPLLVLTARTERLRNAKKIKKETIKRTEELKDMGVVVKQKEAIFLTAERTMTGKQLARLLKKNKK